MRKKIIQKELKISIIIPVFNVEKYIIECINSVFLQTYKNIEIIIIDDCGTDKSMKIIYDYLKISPLNIEVIIIHHPYNKGLSAARNIGIRKATGKYIYFIDGDDYISPNSIESFVKLAVKYNNPPIIFGSAIEVPTKWRNVTISVDSPTIPQYINDNKWIRKNYFNRKEPLPITAWNKLIRRDHLIKHNLYFYEGIIYEDKLWYWCIGNTINQIVFNKENTYYYRFVPTSIINKEYCTINLRSEMIIIRELTRNISHKYFIVQIIYILYYSHSLYCKKSKEKNVVPRIIRYPKALAFYFKCLFFSSIF